MNHPTSLFAEYVDDALAPSERQRVEAHLRSCQMCAAEVEAAVAARDALRTLPSEPVPLGVTSPVIARARGGSEQPASAAAVHLHPKAQRNRYAGLYRVVAAAAVIAVVGVFAASLFNRTGEDAATSGAGPTPEDFMKVQDADPGRFDRDGNYTAGELTAYAEREVRAYAYAPPGDQTDMAGTGDSEAMAPAASASPAEEVPALSVGTTESAPDSGNKEVRSVPPGVEPISNSSRYRKCLNTIGAYDHGGTLVSSFEGRYLDVPAYFATLTEGPAADAPHDRLVVWALRKEDCWVLAFTQQRFPSATPSPLPTDYMHPLP
jgi:hypothetical protein